MNQAEVTVVAADLLMVTLAVHDPTPRSSSSYASASSVLSMP